jgi:hypothetical protein
MTNSNGVLEAPKIENQKPLQPLLDYGCSNWSSQRAADLYDSGVKLWRKADLRDVEQQLAQSDTNNTFTVRCIDDNMVLIQNPIVGVQRSIWSVDTYYPYAELTFAII